MRRSKKALAAARRAAALKGVETKRRAAAEAEEKRIARANVRRARKAARLAAARAEAERQECLRHERSERARRSWEKRKARAIVEPALRKFIGAKERFAPHATIEERYLAWYDAKQGAREALGKKRWGQIMQDIGEAMGWDDWTIEVYSDT